MALPPGQTADASVTVARGAEEGARQYDPKMAKAMAALSKMAYCGPMEGTAEATLKSTSSLMREAGLEISNPKLVVHSDLGAAKADFALIVGFKRLGSPDSLPARGCIVAFRGTDNRVNNEELAKRELEAWDATGHTCEGCRVLAGYRVVWKQLKPGIVENLGALGCQSGDPVFVTGHSMGAGLTAVAMYDLKSQEGYAVQPSYSFESPRVGNGAFARSFNGLFGRSVSMFRITHMNDGVPHFPAGDEYVHVGCQVWYPGDDAERYTICGNATVSPGCGNDGVSTDGICPLAAADCTDRACRERCGFPPAGGPHCQHPLAPADNFCDFAGDTTEHAQREFERSCIWGERASLTPMPWRGPAAPSAAGERASLTPMPSRGPAAPSAAGATASSTLMPSRGPAAPSAAGETASLTPMPSRGPTAPSAAGEAGADASEAVGSCLEQNTAWMPLDMLGSLLTQEESSSACQARCRRTRGCEHFSYFAGTGGCHVADSTAYRQSGSLGFVAGPRTCRRPDIEGKFVRGCLGIHGSSRAGVRRCAGGSSPLLARNQ